MPGPVDFGGSGRAAAARQPKLDLGYGPMRTYVRVRGDLDPARRRRCVLRLGGAAGRPAAARPPHDRRRRSGDGGELRGARFRHPRWDGRRAGAPAVPRRGRRPAALLGLHGGEQGAVRPLRGDRAACRGDVDGGGVPRRAGTGADLRNAASNRRAAAAPGPGARRAGGHRGRRQDEGARQDGEPRRKARRAAGHRARPGGGVPAAPARRGTVGGRPRHGRQAPRPRDPDDRAARAPRRGRAGDVPRGPRRAPPPRDRQPPRPPPGAPGAAAPLDRHPVRVRRRWRSPGPNSMRCW